MKPATALVPIGNITTLIRSVRGQRVILNADLAQLYGVSTKRLNEQFRRNRERFPEDSAFRLTADEAAGLGSQTATLDAKASLRSQNATSSSHGGRRYLPYAFTEHGALMAANILNSPRAVAMSGEDTRAPGPFLNPPCRDPDAPIPALTSPVPSPLWRCMRPLICMFLWASTVLPAMAAAGLSVDERGELLLRAAPFHGVGVNYYDAFTRTLGQAAPTNYDAGFRELAVRKIPFVRFSAGGFWPKDWGLYQTNRPEHFARLDGVVRSAERHGVGLIPSLFWHLGTVPDLVGEPCNRWGDPASRTTAFMRQYTREVVTRYTASPAIWGWEFGNEYNLLADLPNAAQHRPFVAPSLGTPTQRTTEDDLTHAAFRVAMREFALEVRQHDPQRPIVSGNATPRPSAWHQMRERSWKKDTAEQFAEMFAADNPSPMNTLSVRGYDLATDLERLPQAMAVARTLKKALFVGEFGVPGVTTAESKEKFAAILAAIETNRVPLSALWVFDYASQAKDWNVTATNDRAWQLDAIQQANARMRAKR